MPRSFVNYANVVVACPDEFCSILDNFSEKNLFSDANELFREVRRKIRIRLGTHITYQNVSLLFDNHAVENCIYVGFVVVEPDSDMRDCSES